MRCRLGIGSVTAVAVALWMAGRAEALEVVRTSSIGGVDPIVVDVGAQVFARFEMQRIPGADWTRTLALQRAELALDVRWGTFLRLQVEPDLAAGGALRDAWVGIQPLRELDIRVGRLKTPHGKLDSLSRWELPSLSRGLWNDVIGDRLGFAGRQVAVMPRLRLKELPLKPWIVGGVLGDLSVDTGADAAAAIGVKLSKALDAQVSWHHRAAALIDGGHGNATAAALTYDRRMWLALVEGTIGHAKLIRKDGRAPERDATFMAARMRVMARFDLDDELSLEPVIGAELMDPEITSGNDLGFEVLGGASLRWRQYFRFGIEADVQLGQDRFVVADRTLLTAFLGAAL